MSDTSKNNVKKKMFTVLLTKQELVHLRDLMSMTSESNRSGKTLSQTLADLEHRQDVEETLYVKLYDTCAEAEIPVGHDAPDYVVGVTEPPQLGIFHDDQSNSADEETQS